MPLPQNGLPVSGSARWSTSSLPSALAVAKSSPSVVPSPSDATQIDAATPMLITANWITSVQITAEMPPIAV